MQEEYEEALQDEVNQTLNSTQISPERKRITRRVTALPNELFSTTKTTNTSCNGRLRRQTMQNLSEENHSFASSDSSECLIDGEVTKKIIQDLELSTPENTIMKSVENIERKSDASNNNTGDTSNGSTSLLDVKKLNALSDKRKGGGRKSKENQIVDMDLTGNSGEVLQVTTASKVLSKEGPKRGKSPKERLFVDSLTDSDVTQLTDKTGSFDEINKPSPPKGEEKVSDIESTFPSLRLSSETDKSNFVTIRKGKRKTNDPTTSEPSPPKTQKLVSSSQESATKKTTRRKLYNPDDDLDDSNLKEKEDSMQNKKANITFKKPTIAFTPILLTTRARRFLEENKDKKEAATTKSQTTPPPDKIKVTRTTKSTTKKPTVSQERRETSRKRTSSFYFDTTPIKTTQRKQKKTSIVCTRLHKPEVQMFEQIAKKLGGFFVENEVSSNTSHLVAGEPKRTINLLRALARGCWILRYEWVGFCGVLLCWFVLLFVL